VVKSKRRELKKILELQYGFLDQLVSQGTCDLEEVMVIEDTKSSTLRRKKIASGLAEKLTSGSRDRERVLEVLRMNGQHHVAAFIEHEGRTYCSVDDVFWSVRTFSVSFK
jgi:hypothetical protein